MIGLSGVAVGLAQQEEQPHPPPEGEPAEAEVGVRNGGGANGSPSVVDRFEERPIIEGLWEFTAYTLRSGELRVGNLSLPFDPSQLRWLYLDFGLTDSLQLGTALPANALGVVNLIGKFRFLRSEKGFALALPFRFDLVYRPGRDFLLGTGMAMSWPLEGLTLHGGFWFLLSREKRVQLSTMYAILDATVLPDTKLLMEVDLYPGEGDRLWIRLGTLRRVGAVHIRTAASVLVPGGENLLQLDLFFRF